MFGHLWMVKSPTRKKPRSKVSQIDATKVDLGVEKPLGLGFADVRKAKA